MPAPQPLDEARAMVDAIVDQLQRAAATSSGEVASELRFAEALARTLGDQIARCGDLAPQGPASGVRLARAAVEPVLRRVG